MLLSAPSITQGTGTLPDKRRTSLTHKKEGRQNATQILSAQAKKIYAHNRNKPVGTLRSKPCGDKSTMHLLDSSSAEWLFPFFFCRERKKGLEGRFPFFAGVDGIGMGRGGEAVSQNKRSTTARCWTWSKKQAYCCGHSAGSGVSPTPWPGKRLLVWGT